MLTGLSLTTNKKRCIFGPIMVVVNYVPIPVILKHKDNSLVAVHYLYFLFSSERFVNAISLPDLLIPFEIYNLPTLLLVSNLVIF